MPDIRQVLGFSSFGAALHGNDNLCIVGEFLLPQKRLPQEKKEILQSLSEQRKRQRFRHRQSAFLADLEIRWVQTSGT